MKIYLDEFYFIEVKDTYDLIKRTVITKEDSENFGKETLSTIAYCSTLKQAVTRYINEQEKVTADYLRLRDYLKQHEERMKVLLDKIKENENE